MSRVRQRVRFQICTFTKGPELMEMLVLVAGNVQLSTTLKSSATLSPSPSPESVVASIKATESSFQRQLGETYNDLSDASFRGLRRALPKTRSKLDWDKATGMRLGQQIGGGAQ